MQSSARGLALAGIAGPVAFAAAAIIGGAVEDGYSHDGYSHIDNFVSELAAEGSGARVLMTVGFIVFGACILLFAASLRLLRPAAVALAVVVALSGIGTLMAGTFACDEGCPTQGDRSTHQQLHDVSSVITFSSWIIAPFVAGWQLRGTRYARVSVALGLLALAVGLALASYVDRQPDDPVGLLQRTLLVIVGVWFTMTAVRLRSDADQSQVGRRS